MKLFEIIKTILCIIQHMTVVHHFTEKKQVIIPLTDVEGGAVLRSVAGFWTSSRDGVVVILLWRGGARTGKRKCMEDGICTRHQILSGSELFYKVRRIVKGKCKLTVVGRTF